MGMAAPIYYTAEMVRALPDDGNRYEVVRGELPVTPAPRPIGASGRVSPSARSAPLQAARRSWSGFFLLPATGGARSTIAAAAAATRSKSLRVRGGITVEPPDGGRLLLEVSCSEGARALRPGAAYAV